jgi:hypothetical protein
VTPVTLWRRTLTSGLECSRLRFRAMDDLLFDWFEPTDEFACGHCGSALSWRGTDHSNASFVWRQGLVAPVDQRGIAPEAKMGAEQRAPYRLPSTFKMLGICDQFHATEATGRCRGEVWSDMEVAPAPAEWTPNLGPPLLEEPGVEALSDDEFAALGRFVRALVNHDEAVLREAGAYDHGDPYEFTRRWRLWDHVDLIMPPGEPRTWQMHVFRHRSDLPASIVFDMFTEQEGRSDLTLEVDLVAGTDGGPLVRFGNLHVM